MYAVVLTAAPREEKVTGVLKRGFRQTLPVSNGFSYKRFSLSLLLMQKLNPALFPSTLSSKEGIHEKIKNENNFGSGLRFLPESKVVFFSQRRFV